MSLTPGHSISFYEILGPLGAGGMGEVYRARDTRLEREVAIKVLPEHFAEDEERLKRFEREAKTLATLHHPNVASIFGIDQEGDICFLALELVPGEDLATRLARGHLPLDEAIDVCRQIAEGLEAAHEAGVVHRDLKPANVCITPSGEVKVLDFGLAKPIHPKASKEGTPTAESDSFLVTSEGMVLGTPTYMSPEQARGKQVDRRTDIWAFGCVLYECLTGKRAFEGEVFGDLVASILEREPDLDALPATTPPHIRRLLQRALTKDPRGRLRDIGEARVTLSGGEEELDSSPERRTSRGLVFALGALTVGLTLALWIVLGGERSSGEAASGEVAGGGQSSAPPSLVFEVPPPPGTRLIELAISPDGESIVFRAENASGEVHLWVRDLSSGETRRLAGTLGAEEPFWSPDSKSLGFFSQDRLIRIDVATGRSEVLRGVTSNRGGAWSPEGQIVHRGTEARGLEVTSLQTGTSTPATVIDSDTGENQHRFPAFLPDGEHIVYYSRNPVHPDLAGLYVIRIGSGAPTFLGRASSSAVFAEPGYLLYRRDAYLIAQAFDVAALSWSGDPITLADDLWYDPSITAMVSVSVSKTGTLAYRTGGPETHELVWFDREGTVIETVGGVDSYLSPSLSPDGQRLMVGRPGQGDERYVWLMELDSGDQRQLTFSSDAAGQHWFSPDGERAILGLYNGPHLALFEKEISSGADPVCLTAGSNATATDWPSEHLVVYNAFDTENRSDAIRLLDLRDGSSRLYKSSPESETFGVVSPDGRWIAYMSDQTGRYEVYVESFPEPGRRWRISTESGFQPRWHPAGNELFFLTADRTLMSARVVTSGDNFEWSPPQALFQTEVDHLGPRKGCSSYQIGSDGDRFLVLTRQAQGVAPAVAILNWTQRLEELAQ